MHAWLGQQEALSEAPNLFHAWERPQQGMCPLPRPGRSHTQGWAGGAWWPGPGPRPFLFLWGQSHWRAPRGRRPDAAGGSPSAPTSACSIHLAPRARAPLPPGDLGRRGGRPVDAAAGRGAVAVDVEVAAVLLPVCLLPETQGHAPVTLARLPVTLGLVELACGEWSVRPRGHRGPPKVVPGWPHHRPGAAPGLQAQEVRAGAQPLAPPALQVPLMCGKRRTMEAHWTVLSWGN